MADGMKCPAMKWGTGDDQNALKDFRKRLERWFAIKDVAEVKQHNYIIFQGGEIAEERAKTWTLTDEELKEPKNVWQQLEQSVGLADNFRIHRLTLGSMQQLTDETIDEFYTRIRGVGLKCKFHSLDERLIDQMIKGTKCSDSRKELLGEAETLTIAETLKMCRKHEASEAHLKAFEGVGNNGATPKIEAVRFSKKPEAKYVPYKTRNNYAHKREEIVKDCSFCGKTHEKNKFKCPAWGASCKNCGGKNHYKIKCRKQPDVRCVEQASDSDGEE